MLTVSAEPNRIVVEPTVVRASDREAAIRAQVASALRRHKIVSIVNRLVDQDGTAVPLGTLAEELPAAFPTVEANSESWLTYARAFAQWLAYAGLATFSRDGLTRAPENATPTMRLLSGAVPVRVRSAFPQGPAGPAEQLLQHLADPSKPRPSDRRRQPALRDLALLGVVELDEHDNVILTRSDLMEAGLLRADVLRSLVEEMPGARDALDLLAGEPAAPPARVGAIFKKAHRADWVDSTTHSIGKYFRSWARSCGVPTALRDGGKSAIGTEQLQVKFEPEAAWAPEPEPE